MKTQYVIENIYDDIEDIIFDTVNPNESPNEFKETINLILFELNKRWGNKNDVFHK